MEKIHKETEKYQLTLWVDLESKCTCDKCTSKRLKKEIEDLKT